jgi:hypothetical protein
MAEAIADAFQRSVPRHTTRLFAFDPKTDIQRFKYAISRLEAEFERLIYIVDEHSETEQARMELIARLSIQLSIPVTFVSCFRMEPREDDNLEVSYWYQAMADLLEGLNTRTFFVGNYSSDLSHKNAELAELLNSGWFGRYDFSDKGSKLVPVKRVQ